MLTHPILPFYIVFLAAYMATLALADSWIVGLGGIRGPSGEALQEPEYDYVLS